MSTPELNTYWAPTEVQKEIYSLLNSDTELVALIGSDKVFDFVPDNTPFPYVTIYIMPFTDRGNATNEGLACEFQISVWYQPGGRNSGVGNLPVQLIQKRIDDLLQNNKLCINGWNTLQLRRTYIDIMTDIDNVTKHGVQRFRLFLGSKV